MPPDVRKELLPSRIQLKNLWATLPEFTRETEGAAPGNKAHQIRWGIAATAHQAAQPGHQVERSR